MERHSAFPQGLEPARISVHAEDLVAPFGKARARHEPDVAQADYGDTHSHSPFVPAPRRWPMRLPGLPGRASIHPVARYGAYHCLPEAGPKSTNLRGSYRKPLASHLHLCLRHEHRTGVFEAGPGSHFRCIPAPIGGTVRADARVRTTGGTRPRGSMAAGRADRHRRKRAGGHRRRPDPRDPCDRDRSANRWVVRHQTRPKSGGLVRVGRPDRPDRPRSAGGLAARSLSRV